ncbi:semaphorin-1A-like [Diadema antillarum]|uniref:semaphorin-1A-like n=1 Tax=Diadema antillarum TaxID=105358 RepID=UPI003A8BBF46
MIIRMELRSWISSSSLIFIIHLATLTQVDGVWKDAEPKLISKDGFSNLRSFSGSHLGSMTLSRDQRLLMVGAQNLFYIMDLNQPIGAQQGIQNYTWYSDDTTIQNCLMKGIEEWECQNFIQVLQPNAADSNKLFVCGTNAQDPRCRYFSNASLTHYVESYGTFISPFNPKQEGTALFADGNLYTGAARDYTVRDSVIFRSQGPSTVLTSKAMDSKWLKIPAFINSFDVGDWVMFFFRELAVEYTSGDAVYSRVGKVCKSDEGGSGWLSAGEWTTFQKIRLNCSFPGAFPFYFNFLQDTYMIPAENDTMFYAVFTTGPHEIPGSAVCVFSLKTIQTIMNEGEFKEQQGGAWYPASPPVSDTVPRPGNCDLDSKALPVTSIRWISAHPLMHESVPNHNNPLPIFDLTRADFRLTQLVVHNQRGVDRDYKVLFLGTDDSRILKVVLVPTEGGSVQSNLLEEISVRPQQGPEKVINMEIVPNHEGKEVLIVHTVSSIVEVPLQRCSNYTSRCGCVQDPYCVWNNFSNECYDFTGDNSFDDQDVSAIQECPDEPPPPTTPPPECICDTSAPSAGSSLKYTTTMVTTSPSTAPPTTTTAVSTTTNSIVSTTLPEWTTSLTSSPVPTGDGDVQGKSTDDSPNASGLDNNLSEGKLTPSLPPSTTFSNNIGPLVISDVDILEVATATPNEVDGIHGDRHVVRPDVFEYPQKNYSLLDQGNVLVLVFLILGWILFTFCGLVVLYQCYSRHHKGIYQPTGTDESILSANHKTKEQKESSILSPNGKALHCEPPPSGMLMEAPWSPPSRTSHTPAGRERDSLGPVNGHSLPRRPMPVPTPTVPLAYRSPQSYAHTVGSLPSPARINKYKHGLSTFNSLDRHRTPAIHNLYVENPRSHELYSPYNGRVMTAEDRRPSGASDSEMYDDDVWQPRMDGEELV